MFQSQLIRRALLASAACCSALLLSGFAQANQLIDVGFGASSAVGAGVVGAAGDQWNQTPGAGNAFTYTANNLIDTTGANTGASVTITANGGGAGFLNTSPNTSISQSYDWSTGNPIQISLSGLTPNTPYSLYVYGVPDPNADLQRPGSFAVAAGNGGATATVTGDTTLLSWVPGVNYAELTVHTNALGQLSFTDNQINGETDLNGFQLRNNTPEPASWCLMGLASLGLLAVGRRAKANRSGARGRSVATK